MLPCSTTSPLGRCLRVMGVYAPIILLLGGCAAAPPPIANNVPKEAGTAAAAVEAAPTAALPAPPPPELSFTPTTAALSPAPAAIALPTTAVLVVAPQQQTAITFDELGVQNMLRSINNVRATAGCPLVSIDPRLHTAATDHARDIAGRGAIDHVGADGATLDDRLSRIGYPFQRRTEILGAGSIQRVVDGWLNEPDDGPHRSALLDCAYTATGVGLAIGGDGGAYWVIDLANE